MKYCDCTGANSIGQLKENIWNKIFFEYVYILIHFDLIQNLCKIIYCRFALHSCLVFGLGQSTRIGETILMMGS